MEFSTKSGVACPDCGTECRFCEPTDVLAARPVKVELVCPHCSRPGSTTLRPDDRESYRPFSYSLPPRGPVASSRWPAARGPSSSSLNRG